MPMGKVTLVGAGPGDEGLLTVAGLECLLHAQVVVYDRLVGQGILDQIPPEAERIDVGKYAGRHPVPQERINQILLEEALAGKEVVRLKGGDCFLFGRGGEELELLKEAGVPFRVIPGITSALAAPAYAGIPVTHRDYCSSLHIITGHKKKDGALDLDYPTLAKLEGTLVFLMSVSTAPQIAQGLLAAGMDPHMPAAIIENGTQPRQRSFPTTLCQLEETLRREKVVSPAIILVGKVALLSSQFNWFDALPLKNRRILVTRPRQEGSRLAHRLRELGAQVDLLPTITRQALPFPLPAADSYDVLLFTSPAGVDCFFQSLWEKGLDARSLGVKRVAAVGSQTEAALKKWGVRADFVPTQYNGAALGQQMLERGFLKKEDRVLIPRAKKASSDLTDRLDEKQIAWTALPVYETLLTQSGPALCPADYDAITFTSASTVEGFAACCPPGTDFSQLPALCIGSQTAAAAHGLGMRITVSPKATIDSMIETLTGGFFHD